MEKMNQVSVTEFMSKSKEEMYDNAVEMVEKYNRLVDICNDSAERMAELVTRHKTYTNALNKDIAERDAKIEKLEKELEGRKEGYTALKELMDTKYIPIDEHNKIIDQFKEEVKKLNKCIMEKNESINTGNEAIINLRKQIGAHVEENKKLEKRIEELKETMMVEEYNHTAKVNNLTNELEKTYQAKEADLKNHNKRDMTLVDELAGKNDKIKNLVQEIEYYKNQERIRTDQLRATESKVEELYKQIEGLTDNCRSKSTEIASLRKEMADIKHELSKEDDHGREGFERYIEHALKEAESEIKDKLNKRFSEEISKISLKKTEKELAKAKMNEKGIPCGEDSIE